MILSADALEAGAAQAGLLRAVIDALPEHIALLDRHGSILAVNEPWRRFADHNGAIAPQAFVGTSYVDVCRIAAEEGDVFANSALQALTQVLEGSCDRTAVVYPCHAPAVRRWFVVHFQRVDHLNNALVLASHREITGAAQPNDPRVAPWRREQATLHLAAVTSGVVRPRLEALDAAQVIASVVETYAGDLEAAGLAIEMRVRGSLPVVASPFMLEWALRTLIDAAVARATHNIRLVAISHLERVMVEVGDDGDWPESDWIQGLNEEPVDEPQLESSDALRIARALVRQQQGTFYVCSNAPGKGMAAGFSLPQVSVP